MNLLRNTYTLHAELISHLNLPELLERPNLLNGPRFNVNSLWRQSVYACCHRLCNKLPIVLLEHALIY
jgi:hypothetical protein